MTLRRISNSHLCCSQAQRFPAGIRSYTVTRRTVKACSASENPSSSASSKNIQMPNGTWWLDKATHSHDIVYGQVWPSSSNSGLLRSASAWRIDMQGSDLSLLAEFCTSASSPRRARACAESSDSPPSDSTGRTDDRPHRYVHPLQTVLSLKGALAPAVGKSDSALDSQ